MKANEYSKFMPYTLRNGTKKVGGRGLRHLELLQVKNICQAKSKHGSVYNSTYINSKFY